MRREYTEIFLKMGKRFSFTRKKIQYFSGTGQCDCLSVTRLCFKMVKMKNFCAEFYHSLNNFKLIFNCGDYEPRTVPGTKNTEINKMFMFLGAPVIRQDSHPPSARKSLVNHT